MNRFIKVLVAAMLMSVAMHAYAVTSNRTVNLDATSNAARDDARARLIVGITDQVNPKSRYGLEVVFAFDVTRLQCLGPFTTQDSVLFYTLYVNNRRLLTFNTKCQYAIPGGMGGDFSTSLIFTDNDEWDEWLQDPFNDPIHAKVYVESHFYAADDYQAPPTSGENHVILDGFLDVTCPCWTLADISALPIEETTASCLTEGGRIDIVQNGFSCEHSYGVGLSSDGSGSCVTNRFSCPDLPDLGGQWINTPESEFSFCLNQIQNRCEELGIDPPDFP